MDSKLVYLVACVLISLCDSAHVDTLIKCSFKDSKCVANGIEKIIKDFSKDGIEDLNIPPFDPLNIKDISIPILGLLNILVNEGRITGVKDCKIDDINNDLDNGATDVKLTCDILVKAKVKLTDNDHFIEKLIGQVAVDGEGDITMKVDKIHMKLKFFYIVIRKDDGELYFQTDLEKFQSEFDVENLQMTASKIVFGELDVSEFIQKYFNENWKSLISTLGKGIFESAMSILKNILKSFFDGLPAKYYYTDDITPYLKN